MRFRATEKADGCLDLAKLPVLVCFGSPRPLYVELYSEKFTADAFRCASMLGSAHSNITLDGKTEFLDDKFTGSASL
jgi:hypothetical protein